MNIEFAIPLWYSRGGYYDACHDELRNGWKGIAIRIRGRRQQDWRVTSVILMFEFGIAWGCLNIGRRK